MKKGWTYKNFGDIVIFDKRFNGIPKDRQNNVVSFKHVTAETLKDMLIDYGNVKLLATGLFSGYTSKEIAGENINTGEVITIPSGGNANIKFYKGDFVDSGNILCIAKDDSSYLKFVHYCLLYQNDFLESCYKGTSIHHPYMPDIWDVKIPIPDVLTQHSIVSRLDAAFAQIDALKANADKQLSEAHQLFQAELTECIRPKEGWEKKTLGDIVKITHGKNQKEVQSPDGSYPIYGSGGTIMGYATDFLCEANTTILGRKGSINNPQFITERFWNVDTAFGISPRDNNNSKFIYYFITSIDWNKKNTGTTLPSLTQLVVSSVPISVPPVDVQSQIVNRLDSLSSRIKQLEEVQRKTISECDALKQAMLKEVFE